MSVKTDHEEERKMMSVPESLKTLLANLLMSSGIHEHHDEKHEMTGNSSCLSIMNLQCELLSDLCRNIYEYLMQCSIKEMPHTRSLNVNKVNVVCGCMNHCPERH